MAAFGKLDLSMLEQPAGPARETVGLDAIAGCGPAADSFPLPAVQDVSGGDCRVAAGPCACLFWGGGSHCPAVLPTVGLLCRAAMLRPAVAAACCCHRNPTFTSSSRHSLLPCLLPAPA